MPRPTTPCTFAAAATLIGAVLAHTPSMAADAPVPMTVAVDATDLEHHRLHVTQTLAVTPGPLTLLAPQWMPGKHGPTGSTARLAGLMVRAGDRVLPWQRDPLRPTAFRVEVPAGVSRLSLEFDHLSPPTSASGRFAMSSEIVSMSWDTTLLVPEGPPVATLPVQPSLRLPAGFTPATALRGPGGALAQAATVAGEAGWWRFEPVSVDTLVDSPVFAGRHVRRIELDPPGTARPVALDVVADNERLLEIEPAQIDAHRRLIEQADRLFGSRHFRHYDLLLSVSDEIGGIGLEHHESSENGVSSRYFKAWATSLGGRDLLPHEYTHSWNGKFRRPADLWTPDYQTPMQGSLLWVYEGMTQYWGRVLAARSGLHTREQALFAWASLAADTAAKTGRQWRPLQDTTTEPAANNGRRKDWRDWQRGVDYYGEGAMLWLEVDTLIREKSGGQRSLDDVARRFFGVEDGRVAPLTYTFADLVRTLNEVQPHDWAGLLRQRLDSVGGPGPQGGIERSGWHLVFTDKENPLAQNADEDEKTEDFSHSLGLRVLAKSGKLDDVRWQGPAFEAGLAPGVQLVAVNGLAWRAERLAQAVTANKGGGHPIELLVRDGERYRTVRIDWRGGLRYPALVRDEGLPDRLGAILSPR